MSQEVLKIIAAYLVNYYGFKVVEDDDEACCSKKKRGTWLGCCPALGGSWALHPGCCLLLLGKVLLEIESLTAINIPFCRGGSDDPLLDPMNNPNIRVNGIV